MRRSTTALWLCLVGLIVAVGVVMVALPWTTELAAIDDDSVSTVLPADDPPPPTSSSTTTTVRSLEDLTPTELAAFSEFVNPTTTTTTTTAPPTTTTTTTYLPPPTTQAPAPPEPEPAYEPAHEPEPLPAYEPAHSGGCVIPAYICQRESGMSYTALNTSSGAGGMYQFMPSTWAGVARQLGMSEWASTPPHTAPPWVQDTFAAYLWDGGRGCYHWSAC